MSTIERPDPEATLFAEALACTVELPAAFCERAAEAATVERAIARAEATLHSIALIEDGHAEEADEAGGRDQALQRIDAKLNLILEMLGRLARRGSDPLPLIRMRWSRHGVALQPPFGTVATERGFLLLQPVDWLPQQIELPVQRLAADGDLLYLRFDPLPLDLEAAIERHLFRLHRRQIAAARR